MSSITTPWSESEIVWLLVLSGIVALFIKASPRPDVPTVLIALAALFRGVKVKKIPEPLIILAAGVVGSLLMAVP